MTAASRGPRGFTLPLTLALAFSIMSLAAALTAIVTVRAKEARTRDADVFALITLESATQATLSRLEVEGAPQVPVWEDRQALNGRQVRLDVMAMKFKVDLRDKPEAIAAVVEDRSLKGRIAGAFAPVGNPPAPRGFGRMIEFMTAIQASPREEDCLRGLMTNGRQIPAPEPVPPHTALTPERLALSPGDLIEVRAELRTTTYTDVLWQRLRYTGSPGRPWRIHDWRRLRLAPEVQACRPGT